MFEILLSLLLSITTANAGIFPFAFWKSGRFTISGCNSLTTLGGGDQLCAVTNTGTTNLTVTGSKTVTYLIVAGGAAGGTSTSVNGGGGAGGLRTGTFTLSTGVKPAVVGIGGAAVVAIGVTGTVGGNSSFNGLTADGGGGGDGDGGGGGNGGSGGGGRFNAVPGGNTVDATEGFDGADGNAAVNGQGGGGCSQTPAASGDVNGGVGGTGCSNSITGSSLVYADGGGGAAFTGGVGGTGGSGGGGTGANPLGAAGSASFCGGGGGGGGQSLASGAGFKGCIYIRWTP